MQKKSDNNESKPLPIKLITFLIVGFFLFLVLGFMIFPAYFDKSPLGKLFLNSPAPWVLSDKELKNFEYTQAQLLGRSVYMERCASCHGISFKGDGPSSVTLRKRAPNFLDPRSQYKNGFTKEGLKKTINFGIPGTEMPKYDYLPESTKKQLVEFLEHVYQNSNLY